MFPVKLLKEESGFSMVEVVVSIVILAIAIIPMVGMFDTGMKASVVSSNYDKARMLATERLERVKALPYYKPDLAANSAVEKYRPGTPVSGTSGIFSYTVTTAYWRESAGNVAAADPADNAVVKPMMQVVVRVTWSGKSYETTGFTALGGT